MQIQWEGRTWQYLDENVGVQDARAVKRETGLNWPGELAEGLSKADPDAIMALMWLVRKQNGISEAIGDVDGSILDFLNAYGEAAMAEAAKADPTAAGTTPVPALVGTSTTSEPATSGASL